MYGRISDPGIGPYPPRVETRVTIVVHPSVQIYGSISDPGMGSYPPRVETHATIGAAPKFSVASYS